MRSSVEVRSSGVAQSTKVSGGREARAVLYAPPLADLIDRPAGGGFQPRRGHLHPHRPKISRQLPLTVAVTMPANNRLTSPIRRSKRR
jgi:hypothetical protein